MKEISAKINAEKKYPVSEAFDILRDVSSVKFVESVDVSVALGVDPRKSDQVVRGASVLPNGTGKTVRVAVLLKVLLLILLKKLVLMWLVWKIWLMRLKR